MKFHMLMHVPEWLSYLVTCWSLERHHKVVKRYLENMTNTSIHYDRSILREATCYHVQVLKSMPDFFTSGLLGAAVPPLEILEVLHNVFGAMALFKVSHVARCNVYECVSKGDVVMGVSGDREFLGRVLLHCSASEQCFTLLETWACVESFATHARWRTRDPAMALVPLEAISGACVWAVDGDSELVALRGPRVRRA